MSQDTPGIDFNTFVLSLSASALVHLGEVDLEGGEAPKPNIPLAVHTIREPREFKLERETWPCDRQPIGLP